MPLTIMLPRERLAAHRAHERTFVCVGPQMGSEIVRTREALGAQRALEGRRVLLNPLGVAALLSVLVLRISKP